MVMRKKQKKIVKVVIEYPPVTTRKWIPPYLRPKIPREPAYIKPEGITQKLEISSLLTIWHHFTLYGDAAILRGSYSQTHKRFRFKSNGYQGSCNCLVACVLSRIYIMEDWNRSLVDRILQMGDNLYEKSLMYLQDRSICMLNVRQVYPNFFLGIQRLTFQVPPEMTKAVISVDQDQGDMICRTLTEFFDCNAMGVISIQCRHIALWKAGYSYYLFDPTEHDVDGTKWPYLAGTGYAYVAKFQTISKMACHLLRDLNKQYTLRLKIYGCVLLRMSPITIKPPETVEEIKEAERKLMAGPEKPCIPRASRPVSRQISKVNSLEDEEDEEEEEEGSEEEGDTPEEQVMQNLRRLEEISPEVVDPDQLSVSKRPSWLANIPLIKRGSVPKAQLPVETLDTQSVTYFSDIKYEKSGILRGRTHQKDKTFSRFREGKQSLSQAVAALTMRRIHKSKHWVRKFVNDILILGETIHHESLKTAPKGPFRITYIMKKITFNDQEFTPEIEEFAIFGRLESDREDLLDLYPALNTYLKVYDGCVVNGPLIVAIWREEDRYYMYDPNERDAQGRASQEWGYACVTWFTSLKELVRLYVENVPKERRQDDFHLSKVVINDYLGVADPWCHFKGIDRGKWILRGTFSQAHHKFKPETRNMQCTATAVMAIAFSNLKQIQDWNPKTVDDVLLAGDALHRATLESLIENSKFVDRKLMISEVKRKFPYKKKEINFIINDCMVNGIIDGNDKHDTLNINKGFVEFFRNYDYGVFTSQGISVAVWKRDDMYYYFDSHSRDPYGIITGYGTACVLRLKKIEDLAKAIETNLGVESRYMYNISVVGVKFLDQLDPDDIVRQPLNNFIAITENIGILRSTLSAKSKKYEFGSGKQIIPMCLMALTFHKLRPCAEWNQEMIDSIVDLGHKYYEEVIAELEGLDDIEGGIEEVTTLVEEEKARVEEEKRRIAEEKARLEEEKARLEEEKERLEEEKRLAEENPEAAAGDAPVNAEKKVEEDKKEPKKKKSSEKKKESDKKKEAAKKPEAVEEKKEPEKKEPEKKDTEKRKGSAKKKEAVEETPEAVEEPKPEGAEEVKEEYVPPVIVEWRITSENIKKEFVVGVNKITLTVEKIGEGYVEPDLKESLTSYLNENTVATDETSCELLLETENITVSLWRMENQIYLFDPSPRDKTGQVIGKDEWSELIVPEPEPDPEAEGAEGEAGGGDETKEPEPEPVPEPPPAAGGEGGEEGEAVEEIEEEVIPEEEEEPEEYPEIIERDANGRACTMFFYTVDDLMTHIIENTRPNKRTVMPFVLSTVQIENVPDVRITFDKDEDMRENVYSGDWYGFIEIEYGRWILRGLIDMGYHMFPEVNRSKQQIANCLMALGFSKLYAIKKFRPKTVNAILSYGDRLETFMRRKRRDDLTKDKDVSLLSYEIKALAQTITFKLLDYVNSFAIGDKRVNIEITPEVLTGDVKALDHEEVLDVKRALDIFFETNTYGILESKGYLVAIWKGETVKYMFDPHTTGPEGVAGPVGTACITRYLDTTMMADVFNRCLPILGTHKFIIHGCTVEDEKYKRLRQPQTCEKLEKTVRISGFTDVIPGKCILRGGLSQESPKFGRGPNVLSSPIAFIALTMTLIHKPQTWSRPIIDEIINNGEDLYVQTTETLSYNYNPWEDIMDPYRVDKDYHIGVMKANCELRNTGQAGIIEIRDPQILNLRQGLEKFFEENTHGILLSHHFALAVWEEMDDNKPVIYMFDPNPRGPTGLPSPQGTACLVTFATPRIAYEHILSCLTDPEERKQEFVIIPVEIVVGPYHTKGWKCKPDAKPKCDKNKNMAKELAYRKLMEEQKHTKRKTAEERMKEDEKRHMWEGRKTYMELPRGEAILRGFRSQTSTCYSEKSRGYQDIPNCIVSYVTNCIVPINEWTHNEIDLILDVGNQLYIDSYIAYSPKDKKLGLRNVLRTIYIMNKKGHVIVFKPNLLEGWNGPGLSRNLDKFFLQETFTMVWFMDQYVCIFFKKGYYYVFDPHDRNATGCKTRCPGWACVLRYERLDDLACKLVNNLKPDIPEEEIENRYAFILLMLEGGVCQCED